MYILETYLFVSQSSSFTLFTIVKKLSDRKGALIVPHSKYLQIIKKKEYTLPTLKKNPRISLMYLHC